MQRQACESLQYPNLTDMTMLLPWRLHWAFALQSGIQTELLESDFHRWEEELRANTAQAISLSSISGPPEGQKNWSAMEAFVLAEEARRTYVARM